jgi:NAD(P)-dependent dehydrogenase (short-subunit alcohol dehydrogenase family)
MQLHGKVALITGGASGIGRAAALLFAREGASIVVADLNSAAGKVVVDEIVETGGRAFFEAIDVTLAVDCRRVVEAAIRQFGGIDILLNNAGIIRRATVLDLTEDDWDRVMAVNVKAIYLLSREVIPHMQKAGGGSIINTASGWGLTGGARAAVLRVEGGSRSADQGDGDRPRSAEYSGKLYLPRRHRYRDAARRSATTRRGPRPFSCRVGEASARTIGNSGRNRAGRSVPRK